MGSTNLTSPRSRRISIPLSWCSWFLDRALIAALNRNSGCGLCGLAAPTSIVFISPLQIICAFLSNQHPDNLRYFQLSGRHIQLVNMTKLKCPKLRMTSADCQMTINLKCTSWPLKDGGRESRRRGSVAVRSIMCWRRPHEKKLAFLCTVR